MNSEETVKASTIPPLIREKLEDIFAQYGEEEKGLAETDPEACILSLLICVSGRLHEQWRNPIVFERGTYPRSVKAARELLNEKKEEAAALSA